MASKGREVLRGLAGLAGELLGGNAGELVEVAEKFGGLLERAAKKAPKRRPKAEPLELVPALEAGRGARVEGAAERLERRGDGQVIDADYRPAAPAAKPKARRVEVKVRALPRGR